jgi:hypothetical protein
MLDALRKMEKINGKEEVAARNIIIKITFDRIFIFASRSFRVLIVK